MSEPQGRLPNVNGTNQIEKRLWESADQLRANSHLSAQEYSVPVLGLIFLRYADHKFTVMQQEIEGFHHCALPGRWVLPLEGL